MRSGASRIPLVLTVLAVLVLVGVVAVASTGSTPTGSNDGRAPADIVFDTFYSLWLLALLLAAAMLVYGLTQRKAIAREMASRRHRRLAFPAFVGFMLLFTLALYFRLRDWKSIPFVREIGEQGFPSESPAGEAPSGAGTGNTAYEPKFAWIPVLVVLCLAGIGIAAYVLTGRRRTLPPVESEVAEQVADVLDDTLDDLRAEPDPRRAVIAAYARLERALAGSGLPRWQAETAEEYVARILDRLEVEREPVRRLTDLFERAKFSQHPVDGTMKEEAIAALAQIRDELRAAARRREEERELALTEHERAVA